MPQLWHAGLMPMPRLDHLHGQPDGLREHQCGPSGIAAGLGTAPYRARDPMSLAQIGAVIAAYAQAAATALRLGFDGVELHGAHGYLIDQFLWEATNRRSDRYGGGFGERARFAAEVVAAVRAATGPGFPIVLRISQFKPSDYAARIAQSPAELEQLLAPICAAGLSAFHCSQRRFWEAALPGSPLNLAGWAKRLTGLPAITVGSVGLDAEMMDTLAGAPARSCGIEALERRLSAGEFDLVAVGRALIANPDWPQRIASGAPLRGFDRAQLATLASPD